MRIIFWFSIFFIIYAYAGYPVVLYVCCLFTKLPRAKHGDPFLPKMSLLISAYNEEKVIREKLINSLNLDYPRELFEVIVVSDASDDMTESIVEEYKALGVALHHYEGHIGKTACLNRTIPRTNGEIIVFSDANSQYDRHALRGLAEGFVDESVGCVTGWTEYVGSNEQSPGLYARLEMLVKDLESKIGSCVGADGAIFAIRKNLFVPLKDYDINDLVIPLNIVRQGYRVVLGKGIYCLEDSAGSSKKEFTRQTRITARTLRALFNFSDLFNFFKYPLFAFQIISHKLLKFMVPYFLILVTLSSAYLTIRGDAWLYSSAFLILTCCYLFWWIGYRGIKVPLISRIVSITQMFLTFNLAIAIGWIKYLQGETFTTWKTAR
jgi:cellulose synthase/poly-beta-1,6-N-acetylglucosamine synthase-like glycosyltransferase